MKKSNIGAISFNVGQKDSFFFCLLEYFEKGERWFLSSLEYVKDNDKVKEDFIQDKISHYNLNHLIWDIPLSFPLCYSCKEICPGSHSCPQKSIISVKQKLNSLLENDQIMYNKDPKKYEYKRIKSEQRSEIKDGRDEILSKSFKRKLKKGINPYQHRPIDFYVWINYYDQMLKYFKNTYDPLGHIQLSLIHKAFYWKKFFFDKINIMESDTSIIMLELLKGKLIKTIDVANCSKQNQKRYRNNIIKALEKRLNIFIYKHDIDLMLNNNKAFFSFLLAIGGQRYLQKCSLKLPKWTLMPHNNFIIPLFENL